MPSRIFFFANLVPHSPNHRIYSIGDITTFSIDEHYVRCALISVGVFVRSRVANKPALSQLVIQSYEW